VPSSGIGNLLRYPSNGGQFNGSIALKTDSQKLLILTRAGADAKG
jgi:hypothetical protein